MKNSRTQLIGIALVIAGVLAFAGGNPILRLLPSFVWLLLLMLGGAAVWTLSDGRMIFWQRLVLYAGIGIYAIISSGSFAGTAATGFIAMAFILTYLRNTRHWWALIPGGVMTAVAVIITLGRFFPNWDVGPLFMLLLAATFSTLYLLPQERGGQRWARYPALATIFITLIMNDPSGRTPSWLIPLLLIGSGITMLWWMKRKPGGN